MIRSTSRYKLFDMFLLPCTAFCNHMAHTTQTKMGCTNTEMTVLSYALSFQLFEYSRTWAVINSGPYFLVCEA